MVLTSSTDTIANPHRRLKKGIRFENKGRPKPASSWDGWKRKWACKDTTGQKHFSKLRHKSFPIWVLGPSWKGSLRCQTLSDAMSSLSVEPDPFTKKTQVIANQARAGMLVFTSYTVNSVKVVWVWTFLEHWWEPVQSSFDNVFFIFSDFFQNTLEPFFKTRCFGSCPIHVWYPTSTEQPFPNVNLSLFGQCQFCSKLTCVSFFSFDNIIRTGWTMWCSANCAQNKKIQTELPSLGRCENRRKVLQSTWH